MLAANNLTGKVKYGAASISFSIFLASS